MKIYLNNNFLEKQRKYVLTGGPGAGKTTLINFLKEKGYNIIEEVARKLIEEQHRINGKLLPRNNRDAFQREILKRQIGAEESSQGAIIFLDRGIPDGIAFYRLDEITPPIELINEAKKVKYDGVFLLNLLPNYQDDWGYHTDKEIIRINYLLLEVYTELGYQVKKVPALPLAERADWILNHL